MLELETEREGGRRIPTRNKGGLASVVQRVYLRLTTERILLLTIYSHLLSFLFELLPVSITTARTLPLNLRTIDLITPQLDRAPITVLSLIISLGQVLTHLIALRVEVSR